MTRRRAGAAPALVAAVLGGCTSHDLSTPPDPPLTAADRAAVWAAVVLVVLVGAGLLVHRMATTRRPLRLAAGVVLAGWATSAALATAVAVAIVARTVQLLGGGECREIPVEARPETIVFLTCTEGLDAGVGVAVTYLVLFGALTVAVAYGVARVAVTTERPWVLAAEALAAAVGAVLACWHLAGAGVEAGDGWVLVAAVASGFVAAALAADLALSRAGPAPPPPPAPTAPRRGPPP